MVPVGMHEWTDRQGMWEAFRSAATNRSIEVAEDVSHRIESNQLRNGTRYREIL
jgi:hypothetical protein